METFSALLVICVGNSPVPCAFPAQRPVTRSFAVLICARINGWVNNRKAGDLRRHCTHYDVTVMEWNTLANLDKGITWIRVAKWLQRNQTKSKRAFVFYTSCFIMELKQISYMGCCDMYLLSIRAETNNSLVQYVSGIHTPTHMNRYQIGLYFTKTVPDTFTDRS